MTMLSVRQYVELFHLIFLRHLETKIEKTLYALKGGCNLRFYFKSIRYSEDIDFDVRTVAADTLKRKITKLLESQPLAETLHARGIEITGLNEAKQTDTTQRWKLQLRVVGSEMSIPTKIEFSRRGMTEDFSYEQVDLELIRIYNLPRILSNHYTRQAAISQKIYTLAGRTETQSRDVYDLDLLIDGSFGKNQLSKDALTQIDDAVSAAMSISHSDFMGQVVAYLPSEYQEHYKSPKAWDEMQLRVIEALQRSKS